MTDFERLVVEHDTRLNGLVTITIDRPAKRNALDVTTHDELQAVCTELETDHRARVVILTGADPVFSSGAEMTSRRPGAPLNDIDRRARVHLGGRTCEMLERLTQVNIGVANGPAIGGAV